MVLPKSDPSLFNYIGFCEKSKETGEYQINELYIRETERIFYGIHRKIRIYQSFRNRRTIRSASDDAIVWFHNWIVKCSQGPFLEFLYDNGIEDVKSIVIINALTSWARSLIVSMMESASSCVKIFSPLLTILYYQITYDYRALCSCDYNRTHIKCSLTLDC